jgi:hypothetical protein
MVGAKTIGLSLGIGGARRLLFYRFPTANSRQAT